MMDDHPGPENTGDPKKVIVNFGSLRSHLREYIIPAIGLIVIIAVLYAVSKYNFALFHTTVEFATIAIAVAIFLLVWKSRHIVDNNYLVFIGVTFVFIAVLDFLHTLVYQGVGIFPNGGGTLSTRLWIAARYMQAVTLLAAPLLIRRKLRIDLIAIVYLAADIIIVASIFVFNVFPATYIEGTGLTPFKIISEYVISFLLVGAVVLLYRNRDTFDRQVLNNLVIAIVLTIISEITFTEYASFVDIFSVIGHVIRLLAYYFFYRAIIEVGQEKPYNLLYRDLNESEKKYRALSDLSPDPIVVHKDRKILYVNKAGLRFFQVPEMGLLEGRDIMDFIHVDDRPASDARVAAVEKEAIVTPLTEVRFTVGRKVVPTEVTAGPVLWDGWPAVQVVIRDITERKKTEQAIVAARQESERALGVLRSFYENAPIGFAFLDPEFRYVHINENLAGLNGIPAQDHIGKTIGELIPELWAMIKPALEEVLRTGQPKVNVEFTGPFASKPGEKRTWLVNFYRVDLPDGKILGIGTTLVEITDRKRAEEEIVHQNTVLNTAYEELTRVQEELQQNIIELSTREQELRENETKLTDALSEKDVLLSEIHHRVKNNLTAFISLLSLENTYEDSEAGKALKQDLQNRARSMALIHETLYRTGKFSRVDMGVYLRTLGEQIATTYHPSSPVSMIVEAEGVSLDLARATPCGLIVNELITNSFKYAFPPGFNCKSTRNEPCTIQVTLGYDNGDYLLTVADNGVGLPAGFDLKSAKSLGLKLVNFLARHQLRAKVGYDTQEGTEFSLRFKE